MAASGLVDTLRTDTGESVYRRCSEHHHHHLVCDRCGRVTPFEDPRLERAIEDLGERLDYVVGDHDVILRGQCPQCAAAT
jgi:Fur family ferric uptake transcriptional regulator